MGNEIKISELNAKLQALANQADVNKNGVVEEGAENSVFGRLINDAIEKGHNPWDENEDAEAFKKAMGFTQTTETTVAEKVSETVVQANEAKQPETKTEISKYSQVSTEYKKLRDAGKGPYEAYSAVENKFSDKEYKAALKELKVKAKEVDAQIETIMAIQQSGSTESKLQVKRDAREVLAQQDGGKIDKWHKKALNGNNNVVTWASGADSAMKEVRRGQLYKNRAEQIKKDGVSMDDIVGKLGDKCPYLQKVTVKDAEGNEKQVTILEAANLIKPREDGKYDISALSDFVGINGTGADNSQSRQENKPVREQKLNIAELNTVIKTNTENNPNLVGYPDGIDLSKTRIKDKYSKRLVKLTGRHVEKKNILADVKNAFGGALAGGLGTAGALFLGGKDIVKGVVSNRNYLDLNISLDGVSNIEQTLQNLTNDPAIKQMMDEGLANITASGTNISIVVDKTRTQPFIHAASKHYLSNALRGAAIGGAIGLLASTLEYGKSEMERIPNKTDCKSYDEYVTYLDSLVTNKAVKPVYAEIAKQVAQSFIDDNGNFDCAGFNKFLGDEGSNGSRLNRAELMAALEIRKTKVNKPQKPQETQKQKPEYTGSERTIEGEVKPDGKVNKTDKFEDWGVFASRYHCLEGLEGNERFSLGYNAKTKTYNPNSYTRTMMKVMQAITDGDYDLNRLQDLTQKAMSKNWRSELEKENGFSVNTYAALRGNSRTRTFGMDRQNMPTITQVDGNNVKVDICTPDNPLYKVGKQSGGTGKKANIGDVTKYRKEADRYEGGLRTSDGQSIQATDHNDYDNKKKKLGQTHTWVDPQKAKF